MAGIWASACVVLMAAAVSGCGGSITGPVGGGEPMGPAAAASGPGQPVDGIWQLVRGRAPDRRISLIDDYPITLTIVGLGFEGVAACNDYAGTASGEANRWRVVNIASTEIQCSARVNASQDEFFRGFLGAARARLISEDRLRLTGPGVRLVFNRDPAAAPGPWSGVPLPPRSRWRECPCQDLGGAGNPSDRF